MRRIARESWVSTASLSQQSIHVTNGQHPGTGFRHLSCADELRLPHLARNRRRPRALKPLAMKLVAFRIEGSFEASSMNPDIEFHFAPVLDHSGKAEIEGLLGWAVKRGRNRVVRKVAEMEPERTAITVGQKQPSFP